MLDLPHGYQLRLLWLLLPETHAALQPASSKSAILNLNTYPRATLKLWRSERSVLIGQRFSSAAVHSHPREDDDKEDTSNGDHRV